MGDLANQIEAMFPGSVRGVNGPIFDSSGFRVTDADILLDNAVIQVKSGGGKKLTHQMIRTRDATGLRTIAFGPELRGRVVRGVRGEGFEVYSDLASLLQGLRSGR